jgi:hypothetical protein
VGRQRHGHGNLCALPTLPQCSVVVKPPLQNCKWCLNLKKLILCIRQAHCAEESADMHAAVLLMAPAVAGLPARGSHPLTERSTWRVNKLNTGHASHDMH